MLKALQNSYARQSPFYILQCFFAERPELLDTPLMDNILPQALKHDSVALVRAIEFQTHIVDKILLTYLSLYYPAQTLLTTDTKYKQECVQQMLTDLQKHPEYIQKLFAQKNARAITSKSRYDIFIPKVLLYVQQLVSEGHTRIKILDVGCAPQTLFVGAPALEKLVCTLKTTYPLITFDVIGTDITMPEDKAIFVAGNQNIKYVKDSIVHSQFAHEKFDLVFFSMVPLFNGITINRHSRDRAIATLQKISSNGFFIFHLFTGNIVTVFYKGKLRDAFFHADQDSIRRMRQNSLTEALTETLDYSNIKDLAIFYRTQVAQVDFLQNIRMYLYVMLYAYTDIQTRKSLKDWFKQGGIGKMPKLLFQSEDQIKNSLQKLRQQFWEELKTVKYNAIMEEKKGNYPWLELSGFYGTRKGIQIVQYALKHQKKAEKFFGDLLIFIQRSYNQESLGL